MIVISIPFQIETKGGTEDERFDMAIVLITDSTLMPDAEISVTPTVEVKEGESKNDATVSKILDDLEIEIGDTDGTETKKKTKTYVNSFITEVKVEAKADATGEAVPFELNLFMKPNIDIVSLHLYHEYI